eukprot:4387946-Prymnesium_polylepis.1
MHSGHIRALFVGIVGVSDALSDCREFVGTSDVGRCRAFVGHLSGICRALCFDGHTLSVVRVVHLSECRNVGTVVGLSKHCRIVGTLVSDWIGARDVLSLTRSAVMHDAPMGV